MKIYKILGFAVALCFVVPVTLDAQENSISYSYDAGGNLIERKLQVLPQGRIGKFNTPKDTTVLFNVYPNPTNQFINIEGPLPDGKESGEISILAINGQLLRKDIYTGQSKTLPVSDLKPGLYLLEIRYSKEEASIYKIIVGN